MTQTELERARSLYEEAQEALQRGDFETYARKITELGELLKEAESRQQGDTTDQPSVAPSRPRPVPSAG